ncbi:hypothetical protein ACA910_021070 [Epithemia clementina (nom. ined.)]
MGDFWMTSGRSRLKAIERQNNAWKRRQRQRTSGGGGAGIWQISYPPSTQPADHPKRPKSPSEFLGGRKGYVDPFLRRGVVASVRPQVCDVGQQQQPHSGGGMVTSNGAPSTLRYRRIRHPSQQQQQQQQQPPPQNVHGNRILPPNRSRMAPPSQLLQPPITPQQYASFSRQQDSSVVTIPVRGSLLQGSSQHTSPLPPSYGSSLLDPSWHRSETYIFPESRGILQPISHNRELIRTPPPPFHPSDMHFLDGNRSQEYYPVAGDDHLGHNSSYHPNTTAYSIVAEYEGVSNFAEYEFVENPSYYPQNSFEVKWGGAAPTAPRFSYSSVSRETLSHDGSQVPYTAAYGGAYQHQGLMPGEVFDRGIERFKQRQSVGTDDGQPAIRTEFDFLPSELTCETYPTAQMSILSDEKGAEQSHSENSRFAAGGGFHSPPPAHSIQQQRPPRGPPRTAHSDNPGTGVAGRNLGTCTDTDIFLGFDLQDPRLNPDEEPSSFLPRSTERHMGNRNSNVGVELGRGQLQGQYTEVGSAVKASGLARFQKQPPGEENDPDYPVDQGPDNKKQRTKGPLTYQAWRGPNKPSTASTLRPQSAPAKCSLDASPRDEVFLEPKAKESSGSQTNKTLLGNQLLASAASPIRNQSNAVQSEETECEEQSDHGHPKERFPTFRAPDWVQFYIDGVEVEMRGEPIQHSPKNAPEREDYEPIHHSPKNAAERQGDEPIHHSPKNCVEMRANDPINLSPEKVLVSPKTKALLELFDSPTPQHQDTNNRKKQDSRGAHNTNGDSSVDDFESLSDEDFLNATSLWGT